MCRRNHGHIATRAPHKQLIGSIGLSILIEILTTVIINKE